MSRKIIFLASFLFLFSCKKDPIETIVYTNDFESNDLTNISNGRFTQFNHTSVLGRYNKSGFELTVNDLSLHSQVLITFDLYIHDSWDGNESSVGGPDFWQMKVDDKLMINTTFANRPCQGFNCPTQAYPSDFPVDNYPRTGEVPVTLPGACVLAGEKGTSLYKISKLFKHTNSSLHIEFLDQLKQSNAVQFTEQCDESWSLDNLQIKVVQR